MERITESDIYAELVERYRRPPPVQPGDITLEKFGKDCGMAVDAARTVLQRLAREGKLVTVKRTNGNGREVVVYRIPGT